MVLLIVVSLLLCAPATGSKTADNGTTAETSDDASGETTTSSSSSSPSIEHRGRYAGDSQRSMSTKTDVVGVQFYAPPVVHGTSATTTVGLYGRQLRPRYHRPQPTRYTHRQPHYYYRTTPWGDEPTATVLHTRDSGANTDGGGPILMNPLMSTYDDGPSTARYSSPFREQLPSRVGDKHAHRTQPTAMAEYHPGDVAPLTFLTAQPYDPTLLDHMPAIQLTLQNAADKAPPTLPSSVLQHHRHAAINRQPPAYGPSSALHQLQLVQHASHHPRHHHHHRHLPHNRYATTGRYTQVPFLYNLPAPPVQRNLAPTEYDLVTRFNRLLRQRERDYDDAPTAYRPAGAGDEFGVDAEDNDDDDEKVIHSSRPVAKPKRKKKTKKKKKAKTTKKKTPPPPPPPAPVEEEQQEEEDYDGLLQPQQGEDERADDDQQQQQPVSEEQESQNVITSQQLPEGTAVRVSDADVSNEINEPSRLSEQFDGDPTFKDGTGERVEFQLHGLGGPESYKFGFDTGKGTNRQFRYEERDSTGNVHGHYGYLDNDGKMQMYNYSSHPELGFHSQKSEALET